jgi:hypothetical protein
MKLANSWLAMAAAIASCGITDIALADTVNARCDLYPKGEDRATSSSPCTFSQRQGAVSIQLKNGKRYDLTPAGDRPGNYRDQNGREAYRQEGKLSMQTSVTLKVARRLPLYLKVSGEMNCDR